MQGIPNKFIIQKLGKSLPYIVDLKVPTGALSRIELEEVDGILWFQKGWQEFMEQYSIDVGHFLVFKYDGKSQFCVLIFDMSGNEILYNAGESRKRKEITDYPSSEDDSIAKKYSHKEALMMKRRLKSQAKDGSIQIAGSFKSSYPYFIIYMQPSYVNGIYMPIPKKFSKKYLPEGLDSLTIQASSERRKWQVGCNLNNTHMRMCRGLAKFIRESGVKLGDICAFELINKEDAVLKLNIL
ncbi:hypothetical protein IFM89_009515 [Coptis chinensis]|uniref:TF-B3 domain-containing protein n=1 Tax=Coptis chinensis TaxID=261450 RepID=A0A835LGS3_9MAGN|nr:hypothetical protein IFM89_009515 [Coptis chinensis]